MKNKKPIKGESEINTQAILGTYEGECADATITNNNGLDITQEVWEEVFNSDTFKQGIEHGWYIGFLGHPEQPDCMDFRNACIVQREGHIEPNGKVMGKFDLIDTPVGRIVKTFQDAGVTFGISVRGAGDIVSNSVTPGTFDYRGFDLVAFPAFPESIPVFKSIAASSDINEQAKYKKICAAVEAELPNINEVGALDIIQDQFAPQSDLYSKIEDRKAELTENSDEDSSEDFENCKAKSLVKLYSDLLCKYNQAKKQIEDLNVQLNYTTVNSARKLASIQRITADQQRLQSEKLDKIDSSTQQLIVQNHELKKQNKELESKYNSSIKASSRLKSKIKDLEDSNLKYDKKVKTVENSLRRKDDKISKLQSDLDETFRQADLANSRTSNLDEKVSSLKSEVAASKKLLKEFQQAYGELYASATGLDFSNIPITASTNVDMLRSLINNQGSNHYESNEFDAPIPSDLDDDVDGIVTL